ncbi:MAG: hypothetical protein ACRETK_13945, partial [Steroidobacteraceae bacterium]
LRDGAGLSVAAITGTTSAMDCPVTEPGVVPTRAQIERLERCMRECPQLTIEPVHRFAGGLYAREITIPAGTLLTGKVHRFEHLNIISEGDITVWTEDGMRRLRAPCTLVSRPGTKRVGYAHKTTVWTTIHATPLTDLEAIERELIEPDSLVEADPTTLLEAAA